MNSALAYLVTGVAEEGGVMTEKHVGLSAHPSGICSFLAPKVSTYGPWALEEQWDSWVRCF